MNPRPTRVTSPRTADAFAWTDVAELALALSHEFPSATPEMIAAAVGRSFALGRAALRQELAVSDMPDQPYSERRANAAPPRPFSRARRIALAL